MIYDRHVRRAFFCDARELLSVVMFNSAKQHSVAQIDGTDEWALSVVVVEINAAFFCEQLGSMVKIGVLAI